MESEITIEISIPVTFSATKGYPATHTDPACPDEIDDVEFDNDTVIKLVEKYFEDNKDEIDEALLCDANQSAIEYEYEKGEYFHEQKKDAEIEMHWYEVE